MKTKTLFRTTGSALLIGALMLGVVPAAGAQNPPGAAQADITLDDAQRRQLVDQVIIEMNKSYVFPELAKKVETALRQHQKDGAYDDITSPEKMKVRLTEHLRAVTKDKHLGLFYSARPQPERKPDAEPSAEQRAMQLAFMKERNFGVDRIERLPYNIGYLSLSGFAPIKESRETLAATMTVLAHTDALIIDLRKNGGGDPDTVTMLASYLLDQRTHMTDIYYRKGDRTEQKWSDEKVSGLRFGQKKDVYILTSKRTFSAAEDFSYALKHLKRATIIGETTGGGAHPGGVVWLSPHFSMFVPNGRSISPVTKTNWEGVGVAPDVAVAAEDAMKTAHVAVLRKIAATEKDAAKLAKLNTRIAAVQAEDTSASMAP